MNVTFWIVYVIFGIIAQILWSVHKYTDSYVEDIVTSNQES